MQETVVPNLDGAEVLRITVNVMGVTINGQELSIFKTEVVG